MNFSPRLRQILILLLQEDKVVSVKKLADEIKVSKRTVQRELEYIDSSLKSYGLTLQTKTGAGIWLEGEKENKDNFLKELEEEDVIDSGDKEERRKRLTFEILKDRAPKKLYYYGNIFGVSEATISNDMEAIKDWFTQYDLKLIRKQGYGVALEGSEKNYRLAVRRFVDENVSGNLMKYLAQEKELSVLEIIREKESKNVYNLLNNEILKQVITCFKSIRDKRLLRLTENSYIGLILHVTIAVNRILQEEIIEHNQELVENLIKNDDYDLAMRIANSLEEEFLIEIPDVEVAYILLHINAGKLQYIDETGIVQAELSDKEELLEFINDMIMEYDEDMAFELKQDEEFIVGLLAHLKPTFVRLRNHLNISNPLIDQIKDFYPEIFKKSLKVGKLIESRYGYKVPEEEVGFLAMHFGAAGVRLENQKENVRKVSVGIVCASGIGISRLMLTKLKKFIKERAEFNTYGREDLTPQVLKELDFLISSIKLEDLDGDVIRVSPLLDEKELERIDAKVRAYSKTPKKTQKDLDFPKQLEQVHFIITQIRIIINDFQYMKVDSFISFEELLVAITEKLSPYNENRLLIQKDIIRREKIATQIIPEYEFALLHSKTRGVLKPIFAVCLTKDLTEFRDPYFMNIKAVIIMLIPDDDNALENGDIMGHLSSKLVDSNTFLDIILKGDKQEIKSFISKELKNYFNQYLEIV